MDISSAESERAAKVSGLNFVRASCKRGRRARSHESGRRGLKGAGTSISVRAY
jgi:hypothetical protein